MLTGALFFQLLSSVAIIAFILYTFNELNELDSHFLVDMNVFAINLVYCYVYCYYSERVTERSFGIADIAYDTLWYKLPPKEQQLFVLIIVRAHKEFRMSGFGLIDCSLAQFIAVRSFILSILKMNSVEMRVNFLADHAECSFLLFDIASIEIGTNIDLCKQYRFREYKKFVEFLEG